MPAVSISLRLVRKGEAAMLSAIEVYNKPSFAYREETFAILALNAWELLLKARWLSLNANDPRSLYVYETKKTKSGKPSVKRIIKKNRAGNAHTLGLGQLLAKLDASDSSRVHPAVKANLDVLVEIRDNAIHFMNASPALAKQVLEVGTAAVRNFVELARLWFNQDLSRHYLYLLPIGFLPAPGIASALSVSVDEKRLLDYLLAAVKEAQNQPVSDFHVSLEVTLSLKRSSTDAVAAVAITNDPLAPKVVLSEEDIHQKYPWDYRELTDLLKKRYTDFKENQHYHNLRKSLVSNPAYVRTRYLEPGNPKSARKDFYNPNIVAEFDKHYKSKP
jgi:hypothetical protein